MMNLRYSLRFSIVWIVLSCFYSISLSGQYQAGLTQLKEKKFTESAVSFQALASQDPLLFQLGMSRYYGAVGNPAYNLDSAYIIALRVEQQYKSLNAKEKDKLAKDIGTYSPNKNTRAIENLCYQDARQKNTIEALNHTLALVKKPYNTSQAKIIEELRNNLAYEEASKAGTLEAMVTLFDQYGTSIQQKSATIYRASSFKFFDLYIHSKGWTANALFKTQYPQFAWARDTIVMAFTRAQQPRFNGLETFMKKYPGTSFAQVALDTFSQKLAQFGHWRYCLQSLKNWPNLPQKEKVWLRLYQGYRLENPSPKQLQSFKTLYPDFPFPDLLKKDEASAIDYYFEATLKSDSMARMKRFLSDFPAYPKAGTIWAKYAQRISDNAKKPTDLDVLLKNKDLPKDLNETYSKRQRDWVTLLDKQEKERTFASQRPSLYFKIIDREPPSAFRKEVLDSLGHLLMSSDSTKAIKKYLKYPAGPFHAGLLKQLYQKIRRSESIEAIEEFGRDYPQYDPETIKNDLDELESRKIFLTNYSPSKWAQYHQYIQKRAPSHSAFFALQRIIFKDLKSANIRAVTDTLARYAALFTKKNTDYDDLNAMLKEKGKLDNIRPVVFLAKNNISAYCANLSYDEQLLFFCVRSDHSAKPEDIYVSQKTTLGWSEPTAIPEFSLPDVNEAPQSINQNTTEMVIFRDTKLYESKKTATGWGEAEALPSAINFSSWQGDPRYIPNGMIFAAKNNTFKDLYVSFQDENGNWKTPVNLGPNINTGYDERSPYLHSDMKTLYFSSNGHPGFGELDLFMSTRLDDTWTNWSQPKNLGLMYNSDKFDWDFKVNASGKMGYYSIGIGDSSKIVFTDLPESIRPVPVYIFDAIILNQLKAPFKGQIIAREKGNQKILSKVRPDEITGKTVFILPNKNVSLIALPDDDAAPVVIQRELKLVELEPKTTIKDTIIIFNKKETIVESILFDNGSYEVLPDAQPYLEAWAKQIIKNNLAIEIEGHTDNTSSTEYNQILSENRAKAVRQFLIERNCPADKITTQGYGESKPIATNATEVGRAKNRRVVFKRLN